MYHLVRGVIVWLHLYVWFTAGFGRYDEDFHEWLVGCVIAGMFPHFAGLMEPESAEFLRTLYFTLPRIPGFIHAFGEGEEVRNGW